MDVKVMTTEQLLATGHDRSLDSAIKVLVERAHERGDGVAVYVNNDLGHRDLGQWQVVSYGGPEAQLETRGFEKLRTGSHFEHGVDFLPLVLPDIGGVINWRFHLEIIVPSPANTAPESDYLQSAIQPLEFDRYV